MSSDVRNYRIADPKSMEHLGRCLGESCGPGMLIFLEGSLGAGKTTLVRGFLSGRGVTGRVKSPTYTLVEPYLLDTVPVYHMDLYRLGNAQELETIGIRDYLDGHCINLIEWPEKAENQLPSPDLHLLITVMPAGRKVRLSALSVLGKEALKAAEKDPRFRLMARPTD